MAFLDAWLSWPGDGTQGVARPLAHLWRPRAFQFEHGWPSEVMLATISINSEFLRGLTAFPIRAGYATAINWLG